MQTNSNPNMMSQQDVLQKRHSSYDYADNMQKKVKPNNQQDNPHEALAKF